MHPPHPILACFHCVHMQISDAADMVCSSFDVVGKFTATLPTCQASREPGAPCGPEAHFLNLKDDQK